MTAKFRLSPRVLSDPFWGAVLMADEERGPERAALAERVKALEALRGQADYDTGSTGFATDWCLYSLARHFGPRRIATPDDPSIVAFDQVADLYQSLVGTAPGTTAAGG